MASTIQVRVDDDLKAKSDALFKDLGTDTITAIRIFLTQALAVNGFPFEIKRINPIPYEVLTEHEILDKLEKSREHAAQGLHKNAEEGSRDMMDFIDVLIGQPIIKMGRASNLCWILFGKTIVEKGLLGEDIEKGEYSLHFQCPWKIIDTTDYTIKLASGDMYEPNSDNTLNDRFDWEIQGSNLFDEKVEDLFQGKNQIYVKSVNITKSGDMQILFSNMFMLECFVDVSTNQECWRFFKYRGD